MRFYLLTILIVIGIISRSASVNADEEAPITPETLSAQELARNNEAFWQNVSAIDLSYVYEDDKWDEETLTHHPFQTKFQWQWDRESGKEREYLEEPGEEREDFHKKDQYFDGENTYSYRGYELQREYESDVEYYINNEQAARFGTKYEGINYIAIQSYHNAVYRDWLTHTPHILNLNQTEDKNLSFLEIVSKYPTSEPKPSINEEGDLIYTFYIFPNANAAEIFPEEIKESISYKEVRVNLSKNFHPQYIKTVGYMPQEGAEPFRNVSEFEILDYISAHGRYFPKTSEYRLLAENDALVQKHSVTSLKLSLDKSIFETFHILKYTEVDLFNSKMESQGLAQWGSDDAPMRIFPPDTNEYIEYLEALTKTVFNQELEARRRQKADSLTTRIVLCILGLTLVAAAILLKRRNRKTKPGAEQTQG